MSQRRSFFVFLLQQNVKWLTRTCCFYLKGPGCLTMMITAPYFLSVSGLFFFLPAWSGRQVESPIKPAPPTTMVFQFQTFFLFFCHLFSLCTGIIFCMTCWVCSFVFSTTQLSDPFWGSTKHRQALHHFDNRLFSLSSFVALKIVQTTLSYLKGWADLSSNFPLKHEIKHGFYPLLLLAKAT